MIIFLGYNVVTDLIIDFNYYWRKSLIISVIFLSAPVAQFWISSKVRKRLIYKIGINEKFVTLYIYNGTVLKIDKSFIPLQKEKADYFFNSLFGKNGTIRLGKKYDQTFIIRIDNEKYYLSPPLFALEEVGI